MEKRLLILLCLLVATTILVLCIGAHLKSQVLMPFGLLEDKGLIEVPFAVLNDPAARFAMESLRARETQPPTEPTEPALAAVRRKPLKDPLPLPTMEPTTEPPFVEVTESWFDDVLFIGDSRTVGLRDYARLGQADYFCSVGMTVFDATTVKLSDLDFSSMNLETLLRTKRYGKIYISLGLNECGYPYDLLMEGYASLVDTIHRLQPNAVIILQAMITVSRSKANSKWYFSLKNLNRVNEGIHQLTDGDMILYIDANEHFADEEGYLPSDRSADGCHFDISGYREWAQWILKNAKDLNISFG